MGISLLQRGEYGICGVRYIMQIMGERCNIFSGNSMALPSNKVGISGWHHGSGYKRPWSSEGPLSANP